VDLGASEIRGLPFSRIYSLEDIGYVPRGSRLGFDAFKRVAVIHDGVYAVLNDTTWLNLADTSEDGRVPVTNLVHGRDGKSYYGGLGSWGRAEIQADGKLHAISLVPKNSPVWTKATTFEDILITEHGVYFASRSGVAFFNVADEAFEFIELTRASKTFLVGNQVFVSRFGHPLQILDPAQDTVRDIPSSEPHGGADTVVELATKLDENRALLALLSGRLLVFDGTHVTPWAGQARGNITGRISALQHLADGNVAIAVTGKGVFIFSPAGDLLSSLTIPEYHRVSDIASNEPGVMWLINEDSVEKVLYGSGLTWFGQRLGLALAWPLVVNWNNQIMVATGGVLYEAVSSGSNTAARFERLDPQPPYGAWSVAAWGDHLLVGNISGLYSVTTDRRFLPLPAVNGMTHLLMVDDGLCYAIGPTEIALFAWDGKQWTEPAPRIPGVQNPSLVHRAGRSAWIEMGGAGVARVSYRDGRLQLMIVRNEPWATSLWVNIGVVDDVVVLTGSRNERRFFDEASESWCERPELARLLDRSPEWLARVRDDAAGNLWATHNEGLVKFTRTADGYEMDSQTYDLINDRFPTVHVLPGDQVWISASRSLYHVETAASPSVGAFSQPVLVSLIDAKRNGELLTSPAKFPTPLRLLYDQNNLTFRFFSGGYSWRRTPQFEFRLNPAEPWTLLDTGSLLRFPGLHEGLYRLQVRVAGHPDRPCAPLTFPFEILPPWHRTWPAYALYISLGVLTVIGVIRCSGHIARQRNRALEHLVRDRTKQLESTMQKLNDETRVAATLAERDRVAAEIHDSVQQGLSGAILQLDTTLKLPSIIGHVRTRLDVVRKMVSYARQEVQHAVWDMDSPLLERNDLGDALQKLTSFVAADLLRPDIVISGCPIELPRSTTHHLLRIAQEAATNAIRHATAHRIEIRLEYRADAVALSISDDGTGFHSEAVLNQPGHFGLRGIRSRAKKLGGSLTVASSPGEGTLLRIIVPISPTPASFSDAENNHTPQNSNPVG
jgi:signal transduction histidine kinase